MFNQFVCISVIEDEASRDSVGGGKKRRMLTVDFDDENALTSDGEDLVDDPDVIFYHYS